MYLRKIKPQGRLAEVLLLCMDEVNACIEGVIIKKKNK